MPERTVTFRCLRCKHEYRGPYDPVKPQERACPECKSNSVWPMPEKKKA